MNKHEELSKFIRKQQRFALIVSNIFLFIGALVLVSSLVYLLLNLNKSDSLIIRMVPFFVGGLGFIICSQLIKRPKANFRK